jgi:hypothetical protein
MAVNITEERLELTAIDKASSVIKNIDASFSGLRTGLDATRASMAALGATLAVAAVANIIRATAALDDMSEATGASVETLSALQRVARVGGHDFDELTGAVARMVKGLRAGDEEGNKAARA